MIQGVVLTLSLLSSSNINLFITQYVMGNDKTSHIVTGCHGDDSKYLCILCLLG